MFVFKARTGLGEVFEINAVNFMRTTGGREPYKSVRGDGRNVYYAVRPACGRLRFPWGGADPGFGG